MTLSNTSPRTCSRTIRTRNEQEKMIPTGATAVGAVRRRGGMRPGQPIYGDVAAEQMHVPGNPGEKEEREKCSAFTT